jgi:2-alkyl-3-oxoalkanoate reductase
MPKYSREEDNVMLVGIVGANGVLGRVLVPLLLQQNYAVRALVRSPKKGQVLAATDVEIVPCDLLSPEISTRLSSILVGCDAVVHIATAIPPNPTLPGAWDANTRLRTDGTRRLLNASLAIGAKRYIQQSIVMAYPDSGDRWLDEDTPLDTSSTRASICKPVIEMEAMVRAISSEHLRWSILRGGAFVGSGTAQDETIKRLHKGEETVFGDGSNFISPIHVADMAAAIATALERAPADSIFNIVDKPIRQDDYLNNLAAKLGTSTPPRNLTLPRPPSFRCSNLAARDVLGWNPTKGIWPKNTAIASKSI